MKGLRRILASLALALVSNAFAASPAPATGVPLDLHEVLWLGEDARVLLFTAGWEHVLSRIRVQWISTRTAESAPRVLADEGVDVIGMSSCGELKAASATSFTVSCTAVHDPNVGADTTYLVERRGVGKFHAKPVAPSNKSLERSRER